MIIYYRSPLSLNVNIKILLTNLLTSLILLTGRSCLKVNVVNSPMNQSEQIHVARAKRGKTRAGKSRLVLVLFLIGRESGARYFSQSQTVAMQSQSNCEIAFETKLKTALSDKLSNKMYLFKSSPAYLFLLLLKGIDERK